MLRSTFALTTFLLLTLVVGCATAQPRPRSEQRPETPQQIDTAVAWQPTRYEVSPLLPAIPMSGGPLDITVVYPEPAMTRPGVSRNFIFGSVGAGDGVTLTINGDTVPVAPNGAYLAFLPVPKRGGYTLIAQRGIDADTLIHEYAVPSGGASDAPPRVRDLHERPMLGVVTGGVDTMASGSDIAYGAPTKTADRRWTFPKGARLAVRERDGDHLRVDMAGETAWVEQKYVTVSSDQPKSSEVGLELEMRRGEEGWVDLVIPVNFAPFAVDPQDHAITFTFYNAISYELEKLSDDLTASATGEPTDDPVYSVRNMPDLLIDGYTWRRDADRDVVTLRVDLRRPLWGFKAVYEYDGDLVLRIRRPNTLSSDAPLRGLTIMIDAGHPPRGATGPTGLSEAEANLNIALVLERKLKERGAHVVMTRSDGNAIYSETDASAELTARVAYAVEQNADILVSVHNNGFPDGVNPWDKNGTETFYYNPFAADLARLLHEEIAAVTGVPALGYKQRSLALARPTWMPAVLTESLYMMHPQQEEALRDPEFLERLAEAHARGIERYVVERGIW